MIYAETIILWGLAYRWWNDEPILGYDTAGGWMDGRGRHRWTKKKNSVSLDMELLGSITLMEKVEGGLPCTRTVWVIGKYLLLFIHSILIQSILSTRYWFCMSFYIFGWRGQRNRNKKTREKEIRLFVWMILVFVCRSQCSRSANRPLPFSSVVKWDNNRQQLKLF